MKTIAATAIILTFAASAFAAEPQAPRAQEADKARTSIVLTAAQLDGVTAGAVQFNPTSITFEKSATWDSTLDDGAAYVFQRNESDLSF